MGPDKEVQPGRLGGGEETVGAMESPTETEERVVEKGASEALGGSPSG